MTLEDFKIEKVDFFGSDCFAILKRKYKWSWRRFRYIPTEEFKIFVEDMSGSQGDDQHTHVYKTLEVANNEFLVLRRQYRF